MRLLGIDYGTVRTGLAIGDTSPFFVQPLDTITSKEPAVVAKRVAEIINEEDVDEVVVGLPVALSGHQEGETFAQIKYFIAELKKLTKKPINTEDERFTSVMAERVHRDYGISKKNNFSRDAVSASIILEAYIEKLKLND